MPFSRYFLHVLLPLTAGVCVYLLFRAPVTWLHGWIGWPYHPIAVTDNFWTRLLKFQFSDICWAYSFTACLLLVSRYNKAVLAAIAVAVMSLIEIVQTTGAPKGFDLADWLCMTAASICALLILKNHERNP